MNKLGTPRDEVISGALDAFFRANLAGYVAQEIGPGVKVRAPLKTGCLRRFAVEVGQFTVIDEWKVCDCSDCSAGATDIYFREVWIWRMSYMGAYSSEAIPLLKEALAHAYRTREFNGGRGPDRHIKGDLVYENFVEEDGFVNFRGRERISRCDKAGVLGYHEYAGKIMI